jgi:hypothetical protein
MPLSPLSIPLPHEVNMTGSIQPIASPCPPQKEEEMRTFLRELASLVAEIFATFSEIARKERDEIHQLEKTYTLHSRESADLTRSRGNWALGSAIASITVFTVSLAFTNANDRKFVQFISEKTPDFIRPFDAHREAAIRNKDALSQLEMSKIQDKNNHSQSESSSKDQYTQVLQAAIQEARSAAASN